MSIYLPPSLRSFTPRHMCFSTWTDHMPFGYDLVAELRPAITVELGTQGGLSFFAFCQALKEHHIDGVAYAVDTWEGEAHAGQYSEDVFASVRDHAREHYAGQTYLMRMLFEEALKHFDNDSIDLLHIDGLHTYEAVSEDFRNWYPKVKPGGIILFHDVYARVMDFGVWKFWQEIASQYDSFEFKHGFGLGVLQKPGGDGHRGELLSLLLDGNEDTAQDMRALYIHAAKHHESLRKAAKLGKKPGQGQRQGQSPARAKD
jgi:hypothetical protein